MSDQNNIVPVEPSAPESIGVKQPKRLPRYKTAEFKHVYLYVDQYNRLMRLIREKCQEVNVSADGYLIEDDKQIEMLNSPVRSIFISTQVPWMTITLNHESVTLRTSAEDSHTLGVFTKVESLFREFTPSSWSNYKSAITAAVAIAAIAASIISGMDFWMYMIFFIAIIAIAGYIICNDIFGSTFLLNLEPRPKNGFLPTP